MTSYIDREDYVVVYYPSREAGEQAVARQFPPCDDGWLRQMYAMEGRALGFRSFEDYRRFSNRRPGVHPSRKHPGQWYVCHPK